MDMKGTMNVPYDIIRNILIRLPVKCLLRFKAVSKTCLSTISDDPVFVRAHICQSKNSTRQNLLIEGYPHVCEDAKLINIENQRCQIESVLKYPLEKKYGPSNLLCCCEGLLIFWFARSQYRCYSKHNLFVLWNPSSRTFKPFWCHLDELFEAGTLFYGLCYDPLIEDYMFVITDMKQHYAIFHFSNNYWTERKEFLLDGAFQFESPAFDKLTTVGVCFDGAVYWLPYCQYQEKCEIVCFDSRDKKHRIIQKPEGLQKNTKGKWYLDMLGGHLCLSYDNYNSMMQTFTLTKDGDQDKWIELFTVDLSLAPTPCKNAKPLFLTNENEIILRVSINRFVVYDPSKKTFALRIEERWKNLYYSPLPYMDNLFLNSEREIWPLVSSRTAMTLTG